jgi:hypothetical protein
MHIFHPAPIPPVHSGRAETADVSQRLDIDTSNTLKFTIA